MTMPDARSGGVPGQHAGDEPLSGATTTTAEESLRQEGHGDARGQIRQVRDQVVDQAKSTLRQARDRAGSSLTDSRRQAADQIGSIAGAFHRTGEQLRGENQDRIAGLADSFAGQVDQVADYLRDADLRRLGRDVERLAHERPAVVFGAAFAVGLLAARFLKSSESDSRGGEDEYVGAERIGPGGEPAGLGGEFSRGTMAGGFDAPA